MRPLFEKLEKEAEEKRNELGYFERVLRNMNDRSDRILRGDYRMLNQSITNKYYGAGIVTTKITIVKSTDGDWSGLFINGIISFQSHNIPEHEILETLFKSQPFEYETLEVDGDWLGDIGQFSANLSDIPDDAFIKD